MSRPTNQSVPIWAIALAVTVVVWILRGWPLAPFLSSGIIWLCLILTLGIGIFTLLQRTRY